MKKLLTLACIALVAAFAAPAFADDAPENEFTVTLDAWAVNIAGINYRTVEDWTCPGSSSYNYWDTCPSYSTLGLDDEGDVSPVLNLLWLRNGENGVSLTYYRVEGEAGNSNLSPDENYFLRLHSWNSFSEHGDWWEGVIEAEFSEFDLQYVKVLQRASADSWWRAGLGLTIASFEQNDTQYMNNLHLYGTLPPTTPNQYTRQYMTSTEAEWSGWGPAVSLAGSHRLGVDNLRFQGNVNLAYLSGESEWSYDSGWTAAYGGAPDIRFGHSRDENVLKMDVALGLEYEFGFGLLIRGGYRLTHWSNLPSLEMSYDDNASTNLAPDTLFGTRDVSTEGFYLGAGYSWGGGE